MNTGNAPQHIFFLGIAGIGVSALAQVALARGVRVSGSDPNADPETNPAVRRLHEGGATLFREHRAENLADDVDLVAASAAIAEENPEIQEARRRGLRVVSRAELLGELMNSHAGRKIAVAGTHGKTTTTGMIGVLLQEAGLDPTVFVGGEVAALGGNARVGSPEGPFVAEACEAYDSFLSMRPDIVVLTNVEADHLDHYGDTAGVTAAFAQFLGLLNPYGALVVCADDPQAMALRAAAARAVEVFPYGLSDAALIRAEAVDAAQPRPSFALSHAAGRITLNVPGVHNVQNALAAAAVGLVLGVEEAAMIRGLEAFTGAGRRQEILGEIGLEDGSVLVMDDYAHHPTEIRATLDALRAAYPQRRLIAVFQPHLYSRTRDFLPEFADALAEADALLVTDIYAAREALIPGARASDIVSRAAAKKPQMLAAYLPDKEDIPAMLRALIRPGDLAVFLGAGDIRAQGEAFAALLQQGEPATP